MTSPSKHSAILRSSEILNVATKMGHPGMLITGIVTLIYLSPCCPYCYKNAALKRAGRFQGIIQTTQTFNCVPSISSGPIKKGIKAF
jgi:hypothetical protein